MKHVPAEQGFRAEATGPRQASMRSALILLFLGVHAFWAHAAGGAFQTVDLSQFYTSGFSNVMPDVVALPHGAQTLGGIPFLIGGKLEVTGMDAARHGDFVPPQVTGIPVHQKAARIQLLHGARHGQKYGTPLANLVIHFKNGETRTVRLAFGVHAGNYLEEIRARVSFLADPNSGIIWHNEPKSTNEPIARLYQTAIENPLPGEEISTLDFVSLFNRATPILFGVTLDNNDSGPPLKPISSRKALQRAKQFDDAIYRETLKLHVTDASDGKPLGDATAILTIKDDSRSFFFGRYKSDASGGIALSYPPQQTVSLNLRVSSPGHVPSSSLLSVNQSTKWPEILELALEHGNPIGGLVVDSTGKPIRDASVIPFQITQTASNQYTRTDFDVLKTGSDGRWIGAAVSKTLSNLSFEVAHPEYHSGVYQQLSEVELLRTNAIVALEPHIHVAGRVVTTNDAPVAGAMVMLDLGGEPHLTTTCDINGRFTLIVPDPTNSSATLLATAKDYAPAARTVRLDAAAEPVVLNLNAGSTFRMRLIDQNEIPVQGVKVSLQRWDGSQALKWKTVSDDKGLFVWEHAPSGPVTFRYEKPGHSSHTHSMSLPMQGEMTFTYSRMNRIYGKVVDAQTKKPVEQFSYALRYRYKDNQPKRWYRYISGTGRKGNFSTSIGSISRAEFSLVIEARGYEPVVSDLVPSGISTNAFELKKGTPFLGTVVTSDGTAVAKAEVVLIDVTTSASMDVPGKFRRNSSHEIVSSDSKGGFELTPKPEPDFVLAAHPQLGFAQAAVNDVLKSGKITLQPWGYVTGTLRVGEKLEPYQSVALHSNYQFDDAGGRSQPPLYVYYRAKPDSEGRFNFSSVPAGNRVVYLQYNFPGRESGTTKLSHNVPVAVKPGETNDVLIGGSGRTVIGQVKISNPNGIEVDWRRDSHTMHLQRPIQGVPPPFTFPPGATPEERQKLINERNQSLQKFYREQNQRAMFEQRTFVLLFEDDGSFKVPNVPAGSYSINISPTDPRQPNSYRQIGNLNTQVTVPAGEGPHDLGTLRLTLRP